MNSVTVSWARRKPGARETTGGPNWKTAEYLCDGVDDDVEILAAISAVAPNGDVVLDEGQFCVSSIELIYRTLVERNVTLRGVGKIDGLRLEEKE